jgi:hypothetical protein
LDNGINILMLLVFVSAVIGSVAGSFWADPLKVTGLTARLFAIFLLGHALQSMTNLLRIAGRNHAGVSPPRLRARAGSRIADVPAHIGLMVAATTGVLPGLT